MQQPFYSDVPVHPFMIIIVIISVLYTYNFYLFIYFISIHIISCMSRFYVLWHILDMCILRFFYILYKHTITHRKISSPLHRPACLPPARMDSPGVCSHKHNAQSAI